MEKLRRLNRYQKFILLFMIAVILIFTVFYATTISRVGFRYQDSIFVPSHETGNTVYSGKLRGTQASFTVSEDQTVVFRYGDKTYDTYTVKEDPSAVPKNTELSEDLTGIELLCGDDILFRGGFLRGGDPFWLYNENGDLELFNLSYTSGNGTKRDENGNVIDPVAPSAFTILELLNDPELTHKGSWLAWFCGVLICIVNTLSMLFADKLFHLSMSLQIRNADDAEPSDWELAGRYISWAVLPVAAVVCFVLGLQ